MKRFSLCLAACAVVVRAGRSRASPRTTWRGPPAFVAAFQNPDGGFGAKAGDKSSLGATSSAIRVLKNTGGSIPDVLAASSTSCRAATPRAAGSPRPPAARPTSGRPPSA